MTDWADNRVLQCAQICPNLCKIPLSEGKEGLEDRGKGWNLIPSVTVKMFHYECKPMQISVCLPLSGYLAKARKYVPSRAVTFLHHYCFIFFMADAVADCHFSATQDLILWRTLPSCCQIVIDRSWRGKAAKSLFFQSAFFTRPMVFIETRQKVCIDSGIFIIIFGVLIFSKCHHAAVNCVVASLFWLGWKCLL